LLLTKLKMTNKITNKINLEKYSYLLKTDLFKIIIVSLIVLPLMWGITSANFAGNIEDASEHFSKLGVITEIDSSSILVEAKNETPVETYEINVNHLEVIQTEEYESLVFTDLRAGDEIIVQGLTDGKYYFAKRIISFTSNVSIDFDEIADNPPEVASTTATSTDENATSTATSTDETEEDDDSSGGNGGGGNSGSDNSEDATATSTDETTDTATSTDDGTDTTTATSTDETTDETTATSTDETADTATSTDDGVDTTTSTSTDETTDDTTATSTDETTDNSNETDTGTSTSTDETTGEEETEETTPEDQSGEEEGGSEEEFVAENETATSTQ
jgi:hypothetical protein